jgi:hypothetical protein
MLPDRLEDINTIIYKSGEKHNIYTHLGCILLRILLGLLIYFKIGVFKNILFLICLYISVLVFFTHKLLLTKNKTWKVYIRTILIYTISLIINSLENYKYNNFNSNIINISGLLIIIDSLMGLQSRHIQSNFKE